MIPLRLKLSGFLSYRQNVEVDFSTFDIACISGSNGAGKSSLLDAITWSLFGQARKKDESLINNHKDVKAAEVTFTFLYEEQTYQVIRILPRGRSTILDFQIFQSIADDGKEIWRSLSEHSVKETQARIIQVLRLDYETFINAAFFLQGKADQFAQQASGKRKEILGNILGLEIWDVYRQRAADQRKESEKQQASLDGQIQEIVAELSEESERKKKLIEIETFLKEVVLSRKSLETVLKKHKELKASIQQQRILINGMKNNLERMLTSREEMNNRLQVKETEQKEFLKIQERSLEIEKNYANWKKLKSELDDLEILSARFRQQEKIRQPNYESLQLEQARLEQELKGLLLEKQKLDAEHLKINSIEVEFPSLLAALQNIELKLEQKTELEKEVRLHQENLADLRSRNEQLRIEMDEIKSRIDRLEISHGATCPLCGNPLAEADRIHLIDQLTDQGKQKGVEFRNNKLEMDEKSLLTASLHKEISEMSLLEKERLEKSGLLFKNQEKADQFFSSLKQWEEKGSKRLLQVQHSLEKGDFLPEVREKLAEQDQLLSTLGYNPDSHEQVRQMEISRRNSVDEFQKLTNATASLQQLTSEITNLSAQLKILNVEFEKQSTEFNHANDNLLSLEKNFPDLDQAEQDVYDQQEKENQLNQEVGAARQKVDVLKSLKLRVEQLREEKENITRVIGRLRTLERSFGKDGVPALLIEQVLPEIEDKANSLLERLSDGAMSVRFETQSSYKDKKREDLKETLDILISDGAGVRDYELFSGGEAFRVNFALRLALSEVLAHRKGARLQTLVIDEGFGSQDSHGRQRLIEAINEVKQDFAKILVITHLDELKDAFQTRIEVTKTPAGSTIAVI